MGDYRRAVLGIILVTGIIVAARDSQTTETTEQPLSDAVTEAMTVPHESTYGHTHHDAHMKWTVVRSRTPADQQRAAEIVRTLRSILTKYKDVHIAEQEGYKSFLLQVPQPEYHFTNYWRGFKAAFHFDPAQPTSLLYKKTADGYELVGAMYTAPKRMSEYQLKQRVPLSVARWHEHINLCFPPRGTDPKTVDWTRFGVHGSIAAEEECRHAGGRFWPQIFGWMVHVYPFEDTPETIWTHH